MRNFHIIVRIFFMTLVLSATTAHAQFISLHQFPLDYLKSSVLDASGNSVFTKSDQLVGFKNQYAPIGVSGCVLGYSDFRSLCQTVSDGLSFSFTGYTSFKEFKVFVPAGTTFFSLTGNMPQNTQYAVAVRMGSAPTRVASLDPTEYESYRNSLDPYTSFSRLQAGEEIVMVHNYGGNISLAGEARLRSAPLAEGKWIYFRVITGEQIYLLGGLYEIDRNIYKTGYANTVFGTDGDPTGQSCSGCNAVGPSDPIPAPVPTLTGITLSVSKLTVGSTANSVKITPVPTTALLPACSANPATLMQADSIIAASTPNEPVWLLNSTAAAALTTSATVTFTCGAQSASLVVDPAGSVTTISPEVLTDATTGAVTLKVTLTRGSSEIAVDKKADYWVAGVLPVGAMLFPIDQTFFLVPNSASNVLEWKQLGFGASESSVAFKRGVSPVGASDVIEIPLGVSKTTAASFKLQFYFGYKSEMGTYSKAVKIWDSTM